VSDKLRIILLGYIVRGPIGGLAWHHVQYVLGLARLGHDVYFFEDSDDFPCCYNPETDSSGTDPGFGLTFIADAFSRLGLADRWAYHDAHTGNWMGPAAARREEIFRSADLLFNLSGVNPLRPWLLNVPVRVLVDTDPAFTQIRHLTDPPAHAMDAQHTSFFSFAENIRDPDCLIPDDGFAWQPTRQPVVLDAWPVTQANPMGRWTTVMLWDSYQWLEYDGMRFGMKSESFRNYFDMPKRTGREFELAVGSPTTPRELLASSGWHVVNPLEAIRNPWEYQDYIQRSKGEWSVAKHGYVVSRSGWFSERSASYLASGRPVVTEDTGFSRWLSVGHGLLSFSSPEEAVEAVAKVESQYEFHCRGARDLAETFFDAGKVLTSLIERAR
jgi:hypothetical protein